MMDWEKAEVYYLQITNNMGRVKGYRNVNRTCTVVEYRRGKSGKDIQPRKEGENERWFSFTSSMVSYHTVLLRGKMG